MARPLWFVNLLKFTFPNIKLIAKLTRIPIIGKVFDLLLFEGDEIIYLTKDRIISINKEIEKQAKIELFQSIKKLRNKQKWCCPQKFWNTS